VSSAGNGDEQGSTEEKISKKYVIYFFLDAFHWLEKTPC
jgi:hypothetical protein